jgi:hypothetical protein
MGRTSNLSGRYVLINVAFLKERANRRSDPRHSFYRAMLSNSSYESYLLEVGAKSVEVETYRSGPITGRMEIMYARRNGWIEDA